MIFIIIDPFWLKIGALYPSGRAIVNNHPLSFPEVPFYPKQTKNDLLYTSFIAHDKARRIL
jgi:hypothetical protein